jgi:hypothetical protein
MPAVHDTSNKYMLLKALCYRFCLPQFCFLHLKRNLRPESLAGTDSGTIGVFVLQRCKDAGSSKASNQTHVKVVNGNRAS